MRYRPRLSVHHRILSSLNWLFVFYFTKIGFLMNWLISLTQVLLKSIRGRNIDLWEYFNSSQTLCCCFWAEQLIFFAYAQPTKINQSLNYFTVPYLGKKGTENEVEFSFNRTYLHFVHVSFATTIHNYLTSTLVHNNYFWLKKLKNLI